MIFYQVFRRGRRYDPAPLGRLVYEGDSRARAERAFAQATAAARQGAVYLLADGELERRSHAYWLRTRW